MCPVQSIYADSDSIMEQVKKKGGGVLKAALFGAWVGALGTLCHATMEPDKESVDQTYTHSKDTLYRHRKEQRMQETNKERETQNYFHTHTRCE